ncbi:hypothetical protein Agabi119p4_7545 [Agaricus bisporus var. burnettii]|uniref:BTB domain-containing protein n=1 Tax=Agaricus bisporus var. burnettii TaxID=192524 RepID=A0A8H7C7T8_AGABI|nr:hypothetical protein Agabi119p4_7545 [Agaricus bisporus var. burnettii]
MGLPRDQNYYFEDGSCIFSVGGCLFNIHYSLLAQESPFFEKMFSLPQPGSKEQNGRGRSSGMDGGSDDNPVVCQDNVDSFKALCWGLYARPAEIRAQQDAAKVDLKRMMLLAEIARKYDCTDLEEWSVDVLRSHWASSFGEAASGTVTPESSKMWTLEILENLLRLSNEGDIIDPAFQKKIEVQWLSCAFSQAKDSADLRKSLDFADGLNNVRQKGSAYYGALRRTEIMTDATASIPSDFADMVESCGVPEPLMSELNPKQRSRLTRGLWCLTSLRQNMNIRGVYEPHVGCPSTINHQRLWQRFWEAYKGISDPGLVLDYAYARASQRNEWGNGCWLELKPRIEKMIWIFEDNLSKYFMIDD